MPNTPIIKVLFLLLPQQQQQNTTGIVTHKPLISVHLAGTAKGIQSQRPTRDFLEAWSQPAQEYQIRTFGKDRLPQKAL